MLISKVLPEDPFKEILGSLLKKKVNYVRSAAFYMTRSYSLTVWDNL